MQKVLELSDNELTNLIESRRQESSTVAEIIRQQYETNKKVWQNNPDWLQRIPSKKSHARDNRLFLATESVINSLTGRPSRPNAIPANETPDAREIADDLQDYLLAKYRDLGMKKKMRRGLRFLFMSRFIVFKTIWDPAKDDFDTVVKDSRNIKVSKRATSMFDAEFVIEEVPEISIHRLIELFPEKKEAILKKRGIKEGRAFIDNEMVSYCEAWIDGCIIWEFEGMILGKEKHPYWDWDGIKLTEDEMTSFIGTDRKEPKVNGRRRRRQGQDYTGREAEEGKEYETYLYNHFDKPYAPYVFGTVLDIEDSPIGETSLIEQVIPLQEEIDKRKRQISDNAEIVTGRWKVDTDLVTMEKTEAQQISSSTGSVIYGSGVSQGVELVTGTSLPAFVFQEMNHSIEELDNIFGTQPTFRGEGGSTETATGRAILREQSYSRLDEVIDLVDTLHQQMYAWWVQMIKVRYTAEHLVKPIGSEKAQKTISLMRDDIQDGIELNVIPGQILPEDRLFKAERAKEEAQAGLIDPLTYFEETGRDNPMKYAKRLELYKINPLSILELTPEDQQALFEAQQFMSMQQTGMVAQEGMDGGDPKAQALAQFTKQVQELTSSPEFQNLPQEQKVETMNKIKGQYQNLTAAKQ